MLRVAILPYLGWLVFCQVVGLVGGNYLKYHDSIAGVLRFNLESILPWALVPVVYGLSKRDTHRLLQLISVLMAITAICHCVIAVFDLRSMIMTAYYDPAGSATPIHSWRQHALVVAEVVRAWPSGVMLMIYLLVFLSCAKIVGHKHGRGAWASGVITLLVISLSLTVTRVYIALSLTGIGIGTLLALRLRTVSLGTVLTRTATAMLGLALIAAALFALRPDYKDQWLTRLGDFSEDSQIFSRTTSRGLNNLGALEAVKASPLIGYGVQDYPDEFALGSDAVDNLHSDIHPMLSLCLASGIPGLLLFLRMHWLLFKGFFVKCVGDRTRQLALLPYAALIILNVVANSTGAGGTIVGRPVFAFVLFVGLMARDYKTSSGRAHHPGMVVQAAALVDTLSCAPSLSERTA
jgi:hypothetical protein